MPTATPSLDDLVRAMREDAYRLIEASKIDAADPPDTRDEVVRQQMRRASEIIRGAAALGTDLNPACLGIIARSLLEQLITSLWAVRSLDNAHAYLGAAKSELAKALKMNLIAGKAKVKNRYTGEDASKEFLESAQMKNIRKRKNIEEQAKEAEVLDLYTVFYRFLSLETHGHQATPEDGSEVASLCQAHLQGIGAIGRAIGQAGVWWLLHRSCPNNEAIREALGLNHA